MPREFSETGLYERDFSTFLANHAAVSLIVGSRTADGLSELEFPIYSLDLIDFEFVREELQRLEIEVGGRFQHEILHLLQKPFYFRLVSSRVVKMPEDAHPKDIFESFFKEIDKSLLARFKVPFNLETPLSLAAYHAIDTGEEAQPLANILRAIQSKLDEQEIREINAQDVANWLVSRAVILPYQGSRVAFFHQSVTEYLAASEFARRYVKEQKILAGALRLRRWEQSLSPDSKPPAAG